jgi:hypothetical protein
MSTQFIFQFIYKAPKIALSLMLIHPHFITRQKTSSTTNTRRYKKQQRKMRPV